MSGPRHQRLMSRLDGVFDRSGMVTRPPTIGLVREFGRFGAPLGRAPDPASLPHGKGQVVLVVPAFLTTDLFTLSLRRFFIACGYRAFGWDAGVNWGPSPKLRRALDQRVSALVALAGGPIGLVGISLGGVLARDLAHDRPRDIARVITIASPFNLPTASPLEPLVRLCAAFYRLEIDLRRLATPLPMPSTAIFTREDGIVAWQSCRHPDGAGENVEVDGPHLRICTNPDVLRTVVERLGA